MRAVRKVTGTIIPLPRVRIRRVRPDHRLRYRAHHVRGVPIGTHGFLNPGQSRLIVLFGPNGFDIGHATLTLPLRRNTLHV